MDDNVEMKEKLLCQNGILVTVKCESEDPLCKTQNEISAIESDNVTEFKTVVEMEVKEDPGPSVVIKSEPVSDARVHNEMVYVCASNTVVHSDEETGVKQESWWHDVNCKSEESPSAGVEIETKDGASDTEEILGAVPGEASRLCMEETCDNNIQEKQGNKLDCEGMTNNTAASGMETDNDSRRQYKCELCGKNFRWLSELKNHAITHKKDRAYKCAICGNHYKSLSYLKQHHSTHMDKPPHKCEICNKAFIDSSKLKTHQLLHKEKRPYKCKFCNKSYMQSSHLREHYTMKHEGRIPFKCDICGTTFVSASSLEKHTLTHRGENINKCNTYEKSFTQASDLLDELHRCEVCEKKFFDASEFQAHMLFHPHKCDICGKSFTQISKLKKHQLSHTEQRPHKCELCKNSYKHLGHLKEHYALSHGGKGLYRCEMCGKSFTDSAASEAHRLVHQLYKCNICEKTFSNASNLVMHKLVHEGTKPHTSEVSFTQAANLNVCKLVHEDIEVDNVTLGEKT